MPRDASLGCSKVCEFKKFLKFEFKVCGRSLFGGILDLDKQYPYVTAKELNNNLKFVSDHSMV